MNLTGSEADFGFNLIDHKILGNGRFHINQCSNMPKYIVVTLPKILSNVAAVGDCCIVLDYDDCLGLPTLKLLSWSVNRYVLTSNRPHDNASCNCYAVNSGD